MTNSYQTVESERLIGGWGVEGNIAEDVKKSMSKSKVVGIFAAIAMLFVGAVVWNQPCGQRSLFRGLFVETRPLETMNVVYPGETIDFQIPHSGIWQLIVEGNAGYGVHEGEGFAYFTHFWNDGNPGVKYRTIQGKAADGRPVMYLIIGGDSDVVSVEHEFAAALQFSAKPVPNLPEVTIITPTKSKYQDWDGVVKANEQLTWAALGMEKGSAHVLKCNLYRDDVVGVVVDYLRDVPNQQRANLGVWDIKDMHCYVWNLGPDHVTAGGYGTPAHL